MMSNWKTNKTNITTLSSSSSTIKTLPSQPSTSITETTTSVIATKTSSPLTVKERRRIQQRRNSSSPITKIIDYETDLSSFNKTEFIKPIPIYIRNSTVSTNSIQIPINSETTTSSASQFRKSRIPVIINSPSRHNSRRSLSARLRTSNSNNISTISSTTLTAGNNTNNSALLFTSSPTFRKRISSSLSRDSSPRGSVTGNSHYYLNNNFNSSHCYNQLLQKQQLQQQHSQQQQLQLQQQQQQQLNEQKLLHQYQLKKQQQLQYNENKNFLKNLATTTQQSKKQQHYQDDFKGYYNTKNIKGTQNDKVEQHLNNKNFIVSSATIEEKRAGTGNSSSYFQLKENIRVNEKDKTNLQFSERKDILEMSTLLNTDENHSKENNIIKDLQNIELHENINVNNNSNVDVVQTSITENNIIIIQDNNMASKMDDMKVISTSANNIDENLINNQIEKNLNIDCVDNVSETNNLIKLNNKIIDSNDIITNKICVIANGSCVVENQQIKCPNGCCPKPSSCSPISPIAEEEEIAGTGNSPNTNDDRNMISTATKTVTCCANNASSVTTCTSTSSSSSSGVKMKRDTGGMTLNLNGSTVSSANNPIGGTPIKARTPITPKTPHTPKTPSRSNCPTLGNSNSKITPKTPPVTPDSYNTYIDDDLDSVYSYSSGRSTMSCDHPYVARNGTTFSGRKMKYVVHCSAYAGQVGDDYLTPTQRAQRQLRRLKELLTQARQDLEQKDSELLRLTREVVELRLFKASLSSPEDPSNSSDAVTVREAPTDLKTSQDVSPIVDTMMLDDGIKSSPKHVLFHHNNSTGHHHHLHHSSHLSGYAVAGGSSSSSSSHQTSTNYLDKISNSEMQSSFADSGHFEDMTTSHLTQDQACGSDINLAETYEEQRAELIKLYEKKIEELIKTQDEATGDLKKSHNDRIEALLQKLADINTRYADIVPDYEQAKEKIRELEKQLEDLQQKLLEHEETQKKMYLHMYQKGQEAERIARAEQIMEIAHRQPNRVSIPELLQQLQSTQDELENIRVWDSRERGDCALLTAKEAISLWVLGARKTIYRRLIEAQQNKQKVDPEITLQFLKSAIYYFLTDKENSQGHLNAIESILEFSEQEKKNINKARTSK